MKKHLVIAAAALVYFSLPAIACTCSEIRPCDAYANAEVVFVGSVTKVQMSSVRGQLPSKAISTTLTTKTPAAHFSVEEAFLGIEKGEVDIFGEGTTCDYYFEQ